jgi:glutamate racemase
MLQESAAPRQPIPGHFPVTSSSPPSAPPDLPIGVFDSGVGGLSVLRHIRALLPQEHLIYFADTSFAPYGNKAESVVTERALAIAQFLIERGIKALVVACNTATVTSIKALRAHYPDLPIVGVEPGLKPAAALTASGKVGVLATGRTLVGEKFLLLRQQISTASGAQFLLQGCPGLADQIELGELNSPATVALLQRYVQPLLDQGADTLVLGCTHYPFVQEAIQDIASRAGHPVTLVDTGAAVARQLARLLAAAALLRSDLDAAGAAERPRLQACASANPAVLENAFATLLDLHLQVEEAVIFTKTEKIA